jgi:glucosamine 6-phosphate synthetase-like amidotransferase/phosphosugar isomerase protein
MEKTYLTVVCGTPKEKQAYLTHYLKKNEKTNTVMVVPQTTEGAKKAELSYRVLESKNGVSLLSVDLITGRSHQIRVQMATIGTPLYADVKYGGDKAIRNAVEGAEDDAVQGWKDLEAYNVTEKDTLVGVAASGTTPYVIGAITEARKRGLLTACITSNPGAPVTEVAEIPITPVVGPEFVTGSSRMKSGTSQKLICNMITTSIMIGLGRVKGNKMVNMQLSNKKLVDRGTRMLVEELGLPYEEAKSLLLIHGEVQRAMEAYRNSQK